MAFDLVNKIKRTLSVIDTNRTRAEINVRDGRPEAHCTEQDGGADCFQITGCHN